MSREYSKELEEILTYSRENFLRGKESNWDGQSSSNISDSCIGEVIPKLEQAKLYSSNVEKIISYVNTLNEYIKKANTEQSSISDLDKKILYLSNANLLVKLANVELRNYYISEKSKHVTKLNEYNKYIASYKSKIDSLLKS